MILFPVFSPIELFFKFYFSPEELAFTYINCKVSKVNSWMGYSSVMGSLIHTLLYEGFPDSSYGKRIHLQCRRPQFDSWIGKICQRRDRLPTSVFLGFPCTSASKESSCNVGDLGSIPGLERFSGEGKGYTLQYSGLENSMDCLVHGFTKNQTQLSDFHFTLLL